MLLILVLLLLLLLLLLQLLLLRSIDLRVNKLAAALAAQAVLIDLVFVCVCANEEDFVLVINRQLLFIVAVAVEGVIVSSEGGLSLP